jgi:hypothetical protein
VWELVDTRKAVTVLRAVTASSTPAHCQMPARTIVHVPVTVLFAATLAGMLFRGLCTVAWLIWSMTPYEQLFMPSRCVCLGDRVSCPCRKYILHSGKNQIFDMDVWPRGRPLRRVFPMPMPVREVDLRPSIHITGPGLLVEGCTTSSILEYVARLTYSYSELSRSWYRYT